MRRPVDKTSRVWITDLEVAAYLDLADAIYSTMLNVLARTFSIVVPEEQVLLMKVAVELMEASASKSVALARLPAGKSHPALNAGMTFAVPRNSAYGPLHSRARLIFLAQVQSLHAIAEEVLSDERRIRRCAGLGTPSLC
jgi:hypothetical protein